jgi:hypothetical protein
VAHAADLPEPLFLVEAADGQPVDRQVGSCILVVK